MKLSEKLRLLRIEKRETQEDVSKQLGIGITTLRNYENDKLDRIPNTVQLKQLKEHYNVTYEYLLDDDCENKTNETIDIGKKLKLSDKAIKNIKKLQIENPYDKYTVTNTIKVKAFNDFLENFSALEDFVILLDDLKCNLIFLSEIVQIMPLRNLKTSILYYIDKNKQDLLNELFTFYDEKIENIISLYKNGYVFNIPVDNDTIDDLKSNYDELKELCITFNKKEDNIEGLNVDIFHYLSEILELELILESNLYKEIGYLKYSISNIINDYLNNLNDIDINTIFPLNNDDNLDNKVKNFIKNNYNITSKLSDSEKIKYNVPIKKNDD